MIGSVRGAIIWVVLKKIDMEVNDLLADSLALAVHRAELGGPHARVVVPLGSRGAVHLQ